MSFIFKKQLPTKQEIEHLSIEEVKEYLLTLDFPSNYIKLNGPFFPEAYAQSKPNFEDVLLEHHHNMTIIRKIVLLVDSQEVFPTRDNCCVKLGIDPHSHNFELFYDKKSNDFSVNGIDGMLLENKEDRDKLKIIINEFPPSDAELKSFIHK